MPLVAPSILSADFGRLAEEVAAVTSGGADWIHVDVMDGHFVPNLTLGPVVVEAVNRATDLPLDVHLMIENPERYIEDFVKAGADYVTVHQEVVSDLPAIVEQIRAAGAKAGVAINPDTPVETIEDLVGGADLLLVMSVNPGFAAQGFMPVALPKLERLRELRDRAASPCLLEVDGGIKPDNAATAVGAGADVLVAGSAVFGSDDYPGPIAALRSSG